MFIFAIFAKIILFINYGISLVLRGSVKWTISGYTMEILYITLLNVLLGALHCKFVPKLSRKFTQSTEPDITEEEKESASAEEEFEIPEEFRRKYNFLREHAKSLTTLFENYIGRKVSNDTLSRQFQASKDSTFLTMRSRLHADELPPELKSADDGESPAAAARPQPVFPGLPMFVGSGDNHKKLVGL